MNELVCVADFERQALQVLDKNARDFIKGGADDEISLSENKHAFKRWSIVPRMLRDVSVRKLSRTILGKLVHFPIGIAPTGMQKLAHADGELGTARAAESLGTIFILSTGSTCTVEEVATAAPRARKWFQLYISKDRQISKNLIERAEKCGYEAIVFTVDAILFGKRRANIRNKFALPNHMRLVNFDPYRTISSDRSDSSRNSDSSSGDFIMQSNDITEQRLTWKDLDWLKKTTSLPIIIKGILTREDAALAIQHGASGIYVSNHGGRQLDSAPASLDVLEGIVREVQGRCGVYIDGGVGTGSDVFKALALGADMVFTGRPPLWGLAVAGEAGTKRVLEILRDELDLSMALSGVADVTKIGRHSVVRFSNL